MKEATYIVKFGDQFVSARFLTRTYVDGFKRLRQWDPVWRGGAKIRIIKHGVPKDPERCHGGIWMVFSEHGARKPRVRVPAVSV